MVTMASEALITRLIEWGVDTVYGMPGDGTNGIMEARDKLEQFGSND